MNSCDICYNYSRSTHTLTCCNGKQMCMKCKNLYQQILCPFCRQNMNRRPTVIIVNTNINDILEKDKILLSVLNYTIIKVM